MKDIEKKLLNIFDKIDRSDWGLFKFNDIAFNISERIEPSDTKAEIYVGLEHLDPNSIHIRRTGVPSDVKGTKLKVYKGDIIFGKRRAYQRKAAISNFDGICSAHSMVLRANYENINKELFPFFIHSDIFMNRAIDISEGSLSPTIKWKILSEQKFRLPPQLFQKKLADLLWCADQLESKQINLIEEKKIFKKVLMNELLVNGLKNKKNNGKWPVVSLNQLSLDVFKGISSQENNNSGKYCLIPSGANFPNGMAWEKCKRFDKNNLDKEKILIYGDILFNTGGVGTLGRIGFFDGLKKDCFPDSFILVIRSKGDKVLPEYLWSVLQSDYISQLIIKHTQGTTGITSIKTDDILSFKIPLPSVEIQKEISNILFNLDNDLKETNNIMKLTQKLKFSIINTILK